MPNYKLTYFNVRGRAEEARLMFALSGTKFEDSRIERSDWPAYKPKTPLGQLPVLDVDGFEIPQSGAINRYLAKTLGFYGSDVVEQTKIEVLLETMADLKPEVGKLFSAKDDAEKESIKTKIREEVGKANVALVEKLLISNNGGDGFFVGDKISLADITFFTTYDDVLPTYIGGPINMDDAPKARALLKRIAEIPAVVEWRKKRPVTPF